MTHALANSGLHLVGASADADYRRIIICGLPRSGTTCLASIFEAVGCDLGLTSAVKEDRRFHEIVLGDFPAHLRERRFTSYQKIRDEQTAQRDKPWVLKYPMAYQHLHIFQAAWPVEQTLIIAVTRDPLAVGLRNGKSMIMDPGACTLNALADYQGMMFALLAFTQWPVLFVSYEKILSNPLTTVGPLLTAAGIQPTWQDLAKAAASISTENGEYLTESKVSINYNVDCHGDDLIQGWAYVPQDHHRVLDLEIIEPGSPRRIPVPVTITRPDLVQLHGHQTGLCGFMFSRDNYHDAIESSTFSGPWPCLSQMKLRVTGTDYYLEKNQ
jgi:hypothetical protein